MSAWISIVILAAPGAPAAAPVADPVAVKVLELGRGATLARAAAQNPQIAAARAEVARSRAVEGQADAARWPLLTVSVGIMPSQQADLVPGTAVESTRNAWDEFSMDELSVTLGAELDLLQPLYTFGKIGRRREAAAHQVKAEEAQVEMTRSDVALQAAQLYEGLLYAREVATFAEEVVHSLDRTIADTEERVERPEADVTASDVARLRAARAAAELLLHRGETGARNARAGLRAYLVLDEDVAVEPADEVLTPVGGAPSAELGAWIAIARDERPELAALASGVAARQALAKAEEAGYFPDIFLLGHISAAYTPGRDFVDTRYAVDPLYHFVPVILLGLRWQLLANSPGQRRDEELAKATALAETRTWAEAAIPAEVERDLREVERARRDQTSAEEGLEQAKQWLVRAQADFSVGFGTSDELADAVRVYTELRVASLDAIYRFNTGLAALAHSCGVLLNRELSPYEAPDEP